MRKTKNQGPQETRERMLKLAQRLYEGGSVTAQYIRETFGVSKPTSQRDLVVLEQCLPVTATKVKVPRMVKVIAIETSVRLMRR